MYWLVPHQLQQSSVKVCHHSIRKKRTNDGWPIAHHSSHGSRQFTWGTGNTGIIQSICDRYLMSLPASSSTHWRWTRTICGGGGELPGVCGKELLGVCVGGGGLSVMNVDQTALKSHALVFKWWHTLVSVRRIWLTRLFYTNTKAATCAIIKVHCHVQ